MNLLLKFISYSLHKAAVATQLTCLESIEPAEFLYSGYLVSFQHSSFQLNNMFQ